MARTSSSLPAFLLALRQSIVDAGTFTDTCCNLSTEEKMLEYSQGEYVLNITPGNLMPEDQGGEGENETIFKGEIKFRILCQTALDTATNDIIAFTDDGSTTGIYVLFQQLLQVIRFWDKFDTNNNSYLTQPMRILRGPTQPRRDEKHAEYVWLDVISEFKICIASGVI